MTTAIAIAPVKVLPPRRRKEEPAPGLTPKQKAMRHTIIGASEAAAVAGLSPYKGPHDIWAIKTGRVKDEAGLAAERGQLLEPLVARRFVRWLKENGEPDAYVIKDERSLRYGGDDSGSPIGASPDYWVGGLRSGKWALLECKSMTKEAARTEGFGEEGTDQLPDGKLLQCQQQLLVTGLDLNYCAVMIGDQEPLVFKVTPNEGIQNWILTNIPAWYERHVVNDLMPDPDASDAAVRAARLAAAEAIRAAEEVGKVRASKVKLASGLEIDQEADLAALAEAKARQTAAQKEADQAEEEANAITARLLSSVVETPAKQLYSEVGYISISLLATPKWKEIALALGPSAELLAEHTPAPKASARFYPSKKAKGE